MFDQQPTAVFLGTSRWMSTAIIVRVLFAGIAIWCHSARAQQLGINVANDFTLTRISPSLLSQGIDAQIGQMAFGPDGRLYVATLDATKAGPSNQGIFRFDYSPTGQLSNRTKVSDVPSTGLAFHQDPVSNQTFMYIADAYDIFAGPNNGINVKNGVLRRLTDTNGDGSWGGAGDVNQEFVNNVPVEREHRMNQLQVRGNTLFMGIGSMTTDGHSEAAYTGTIGWIQDLTAHSNDTTTPNAAGFDEAFVIPGDGRDRPSTSVTPLVSTDPSKLVVHSRGLRNPYGIGLDGDGNLWATMNNDQGIPGVGTPSDLFFKAERYANYGFPHEFNEIFDPAFRRDDGTPYTDVPEVAAAGFSPTQNVQSTTAEGVVAGYDPAAPNGSLGPSAAAGGVDFVTNNGFKLAWHKDAFIARWVYQDIVAVDIDTGEVVRIAFNFNRVLDVLTDPWGNILVAEAPQGDNDLARIFRIAPNNPHTGAHLIDWNENLSGNWSERLNWGGDFDGNGVIDPPFTVNPNDRIVPHQWGSQRYAVSINRQVAGLQVTLDQNAHVELVTLGNASFYGGDNELHVAAGKTLTVDDRVAIEYGGILSGEGTVNGLVENRHGVVRPTISDSGLHIDGDFAQQAGGKLTIEINAIDEHARLTVAGSATLAGTLELLINEGANLASLIGQTFDVIDWSGPLVAGNNFDQITGQPGLVWDINALYTTGEVTLLSAGLTPGDFDGDGDVDGADFVIWQTNFPTSSGAVWATGDADSDGDVDGADFVAWQTNFPYTPVPGTSPVPEPGAWIPALVALFEVVVRVRRGRLKVG